MENNKAVSGKPEEGQGGGKGKESLLSTVEKYLEALEIQYIRNGDVFESRLRGKYVRQDILFVVEQFELRTRILFINPDYLGVSLNALPEQIRSKVMDLALKLNERASTVKFGLDKDGYMISETEISMFGNEPTFEAFRFSFEILFYLGDKSYPDFARLMFPEQCQPVSEQGMDTLAHDRSMLN